MARSLRLPLVVASLALALWLSPSRVEAQSEGRAIDPQYQTWLGFFFQGPIAGDLFFQADVHYRTFPDFFPNWILLRPALALRLMDGMFVSLGYAWTPSWSSQSASMVDEHRIWEQWMYDFPLDAQSGIRFQIRTRVEQRIRHPRGPNGEEAQLGLRLRQMVRVQVPLTTDRAWLFVLWDEMFFMLSEAGSAETNIWQRPGFDQNRLFGGIGYVVIPGVLRLELGYFNQWIHRHDHPRGDLVNHVAMLNTFVSWR